MNKRALVTGASTGIGASIAKKLVANGWDLILVARGQAILEQTKIDLEKIRSHVSVQIEAVDLTDEKACAQMLDRIGRVDLLVNNAGRGVFGEALKESIPDMLTSIQLNCLALTYLTLRIGRQMASAGGGQIINISSLAGFIPSPYFSVYAATKAYVTSLSESLNYEYGRAGVKVNAICPGGVDTTFHRTAGLDERVIKKFGKVILSADEVADSVMKTLNRDRSITVPGLTNKAMAFLFKFLPRSLNIKNTASFYSRYLQSNPQHLK
ncbi:MAG: hypothetical protein A4S09_13800 [Proteobacteria bacterium SG_bin7]|nr:MAG: hypothetical protein A4S09_13800 [Proteobacteria bacterium SG_bin7]